MTAEQRQLVRQERDKRVRSTLKGSKALHEQDLNKADWIPKWYRLSSHKHLQGTDPILYLEEAF